MVLQDGYFDKYCERCDKQYTVMEFKWCESCQTCEDGKQIDVIVNNYKELVWIPYNELTDIKEIGKGGFATVYSAIWKNNKKVALKCLYNSQNIINNILNEVCFSYINYILNT